MIVLGISETHCATAAVLRDGEIIGCASEERFSRLKNDAGYPRRAIDALLDDLKIAPAEIDLVALAGMRAAAREWMNRVLHDEAYHREYYGVRLDGPREAVARRGRKLGARLGLVRRTRGKFGISQAERLGIVAEHLGVRDERIVCLDHHACHAAAAYFGSPFEGAPALVLTNDNSGDGLCATASVAQGTSLLRHEATPSAPGSLGSFYSLVTVLLGMKAGEHEYKVMGLAPYAAPPRAEAAAAALRGVFDLVEDTPALFAWTKRGAALPAPAGEHARPALRRHRRRRPADRRGLAARVDPAHAGPLRRPAPGPGRWRVHERQGQHAARRRGLGARSLRLSVLRRRVERRGRGLSRLPATVRGRGRGADARPFGAGYLGPAVTAEAAEAVIRSRDLAGRYAVSEHERIEERIADLLVSDGVVARCAGRMEFGARALGNRSILGNPADHRVVPLINRMIKNRDFWMPFAPTILREREADYLVNPKGPGLAPHDDRLRHQSEAARRHRRRRPSPRRHGARPHPRGDVATRPTTAWSASSSAGRASAPCSTRPSTCTGSRWSRSAEDAVDTFERSGLPHLALDRFLISKR